jgi:hypothetical protein
VIRAEVLHSRVSLVGDLSPNSFAYVDADWLPSQPQLVPAVFADADGGLAWCDGPRVQPPTDLDVDTAAALTLQAVAEHAAAAVDGVPPRSIEVTGRGLISQQVRVIGRAAAERAKERPRAIIDSTGDPLVIADATRRVADLGIVVLVGEPLGQGFELNLYPDVHVRGLTLVGVAPPLHDSSFRSPSSESVGALEESWREALVRVRLNSFFQVTAPWYRLEA